MSIHRLHHFDVEQAANSSEQQTITGASMKNVQDDTSSIAGSSAPTVVDEYDIPDSDIRSDTKRYRTYPQAWLALFLLVLLRAAAAVFQFTYSVVPGITSEFYRVSMTAVNWLATVQGIVYVLVSFFTGWIFEKLGVKRSVSTALDIVRKLY